MKTWVRVYLYDVMGRRVETIVDGELEKGLHEIVIEPRDLASGVYFLRFEAGEVKKNYKLVFLR